MVRENMKSVLRPCKNFVALAARDILTFCYLRDCLLSHGTSPRSVSGSWHFFTWAVCLRRAQLVLTSGHPVASGVSSDGRLSGRPRSWHEHDLRVTR